MWEMLPFAMTKGTSFKLNFRQTLARSVFTVFLRSHFPSSLYIFLRTLLCPVERKTAGKFKHTVVTLRSGCLKQAKSSYLIHVFFYPPPPPDSPMFVAYWFTILHPNLSSKPSALITSVYYHRQTTGKFQDVILPVMFASEVGLNVETDLIIHSRIYGFILLLITILILTEKDDLSLDLTGHFMTSIKSVASNEK